MRIKVSGKLFKNALLNSMYKTPETVSFYQEDGKLYLQSNSALISNIKVPILESDVDDLDISVIVGSTVQLLNPREDVILEVRGDILQIIQSHFSYGTQRSYESRIPTKAFDMDYSLPYSSDEIKAFNNATKALDEVARVLAGNKESITIRNKKAYIKYSNTGLIMDLDLPDMSITSDALRKVTTALDRSRDSKCCYDKESAVMYFKINADEAVAVPVAEPDNHAVEALEYCLKDTKAVATINFSLYAEYMDAICKAYRKTKVDMSVCQTGLRLFINQLPTSITVGSMSEALCSIQITTAQLQAIHRLFGDCTNVEVRRGENRLCLMQKNSNKVLVIAGLLF